MLQFLQDPVKPVPYITSFTQQMALKKGQKRIMSFTFNKLTELNKIQNHLLFFTFPHSYTFIVVLTTSYGFF